MMLDPNAMTIEQKKTMGLWPEPTLAAHGIIPYARRLTKRQNRPLRVLDIGTMRGENVVFLNDQLDVEYFCVIHSNSTPQIKEIYAKNTAHLSNIMEDFPKQEFDIVCIDAHSNLDKMLPKYYNYTRSGGIFCGNEHELVPVKEALGKFRRSSRIGTPINVSNECWFWIKE